MIANYLTSLRIILLIPLFALLLRGPDQAGWWAFTLFLLLGLIDAISGYLVRQLKQGSTVSSMFDVIADRLMSLSICVGLICAGATTPYVVIPLVILLARDLIVSGLGETFHGKLDIGVSWAERVKIVLQYLGFGFLMVPDVLVLGISVHSIGTVLVGLSAALSLITVGDYAGRAVRYLKSHGWV
jgi:cardiolipin synthase (CMP-forming)